MYIPSKDNTITGTHSWEQVLDTTKRSASYETNCMRIGIVQAVYYEDLTVDVLIVNKKTLGLNKDGTQETEDFPIIRAKIVYCNPFETFPISPGDECVVIFSDREIESWFINGGVNPVGYPRMHSKTDAVAIFAIRSLPKMIQVLQDALHLFYGKSEIIMRDQTFDVKAVTKNVNTTDLNLNAVQTININAANININGVLTINGTPYMDHVHSKGHDGNPTGGVIQ